MRTLSSTWSRTVLSSTISALISPLPAIDERVDHPPAACLVAVSSSHRVCTTPCTHFSLSSVLRCWHPPSFLSQLQHLHPTSDSQNVEREPRRRVRHPQKLHAGQLLRARRGRGEPPAHASFSYAPNHQIPAPPRTHASPPTQYYKRVGATYRNPHFPGVKSCLFLWMNR